MRELRPEVSEGLAGVVRRMLAKNPDDRYQKPRAVMDALAEVFSGPRRSIRPSRHASPLSVTFP